MASQKRRSGGRTTPKGTKPGRVHETHRLDTSDTHSMHGQNIADASSRYTPPTLREQRVSGLLAVLGGLYTATKYH